MYTCMGKPVISLFVYVVYKIKRVYEKYRK